MAATAFVDGEAMRLLRSILPRRSGGVRVSRSTHRAIVRGDRARARRDWGQAAAAYREALRRDPRLVHIAVQLGHALGEQGRLGEAERVYRDAAKLAPRDRDPLLHLAHLLGRREAFAEAAECLAILVERDRDDDEALGEAMRAVANLCEEQRQAAAVRVIHARHIDPVRPCQPAPARGKRRLLFDVSDLIHHLGTGEALTGIQRFQSEVAVQIEAGAVPGLLCLYLGAERAWVALPAAAVAELAARGTIAGEAPAACRSRWERVLLSALTQPAIALRHGDTIVNLGTSWSVCSYPAAVAAAKERSGAAFLTMMFDLIPLLHPHWCTAGLVADFARWFETIVGLADGFIAISRSTANDLVRVAATRMPMSPDRVAVVPLDACSAFGGTPVDPPSARDARPYALLVSTIEPRKGHLTAFEAWSRLIDSHGDHVPDLICVGRDGWLNQAIYARLESEPSLARHVIIRSDVDDVGLAALYAGCDFVLYPSRYEGWGLPITEALCCGKPVVAADNSSLREAGGDFALYFRDDDAVELAAVVDRLIDDPDRRRVLADRIRRDFRPRSWRQIAIQVGDEAERIVAALSSIEPPVRE